MKKRRRGSGVLLLNATYEPITTISLKRAVILVYSEKAEIVASKDGEVRSEKSRLPMPSVVRLLHYVRVPFRSRAPLTRRTLLARDESECCYCGKYASTIDHVIPRSKGGKHDWDNVVSSCVKCNSYKADRTPEQAGMKMRYQPFQPAGTTALVIVIGQVQDEWREFLALA